MKELIAGLLFGILCVGMILQCAEAENGLVNKHCSGLSGYEYGVCQASIY